MDLDVSILVPDGEYRAVISDSEMFLTKTNKPALRLKFRIIEGPHKDKVLFYYCPVLGSGTWKVNELIKAINLSYLYQLTGDNVVEWVEECPEMFVRMEVPLTISVSHNMYGGAIWNTIVGVKS